MTVPTIRDDNFALSRFAPCRFFPPCKGGGEEMGIDFCPAPRGEAEMGLDFLDLTRPAPPHPCPASH